MSNSINLNWSSWSLSYEYLLLVVFGDDLLANIDFHESNDHLN